MRCSSATRSTPSSRSSNAERDLSAYEACRDALVARYGDAVWADEQQQLFHRLPLDASSGRSVPVGTRAGVVDAATASDVIARIAGRAYWRKLFVRKDGAPVAEARRLCETVTRGA